MTKRVPLVTVVPALILLLAPACTSKDTLLKARDAATDLPVGGGGTSGGGGTGGNGGIRGTGGSGGTHGTGGSVGTGGAITDAGVDAGGCGPGFPIGSNRAAGDGCNSCSCTSPGIWICSTRPCQTGDASVGGSGGATGGGGTGGAAGAGGTSGASGGGGTGGAAGSGGKGGAAGSGAGGGGGTGGVTNACLAVQTLDRSCTTPADCFAALNVADCCGRHQYIGLSTTEQTRYAALEQQCKGTWPACACVTRPTITDDGSLMKDSMSVGVTCLQGVCTTFIPACGGPCSTGLTCFSCIEHLTTFAACTTPCNDVDAGSDCPNPSLPRCQLGISGNVDGTYCTTAAQCDQR